MGRYLFSRAWQSAVTLLVASMVVFAGVRAIPGDPARTMAGEEADPEALAAIRDRLGLDDPIPVQYVKFLGDALRGDFGSSIRTGTPVSDLIGSTLPVTLWLSTFAILIAVVVGISAGIVAERFRGRWPEWIASAGAVIGLSVPNFWLGILAITLLAVNLGWFPASGYVPVLSDPVRGVYYLTLPAIILGIGLAAVIMRQTRASMIEAMGSDYVRTARAKGLGRGRILLRYGLRNSLVVVVTIAGLQLGGLISGAVVTERIFGLPGFGKLTLDSVFTRDYPVIQAVVLVVTASYIVINLVVDLLYSVINPRIRVGGDR
ncbi:ABC transporter permease [Tsukamurella spumae]|uniref:ABC transporter permease n=1 Tax=Tsukamurella spumae TaxID=44753 RepID=A0A846X135_9ACTN|nr:ABC transporter permease [Tsukamurella spumae]NKY18974.1 ABC transporter permease [Tsukamurella spumae]